MILLSEELFESNSDRIIESQKQNALASDFYNCTISLTTYSP